MLGFKRLVAPVVVCVGAACAAPAFSQQVPTANTSAEVDAAFRDVLQNPGVLAQQKYARALVDSGNYEGGIAALESLALDPASDPSYKVELAALYYRLGSYAMAQSYVETALADPRLTDSVRKSAQTLLTDLQRRTSSDKMLTASFSVGLQSQSNPTAGPATSDYFQGGVLVPVPDANQANHDFAAFASGNLRHEWDLGFQNSATLVTTGGFFANHFFDAADYNSTELKTDPQDYATVYMTTGVRFQPLAGEVPELTIRPYVAGSEALLSGSQYLATLGGGIEADYAANGGATKLGITYDLRRTLYDTRADIRDSGYQSGHEQYVQLRGSQQVGTYGLLTASLAWRDHRAERDFFAYDAVEAQVSYSHSYANPFSFDDRIWTTTVYGGPSIRDYDGADDSVAPDTVRRDVEWRVGVSQVVGLTDKTSLLLGVEYVHTSSNIVNYAYENVIATGSLVWQF